MSDNVLPMRRKLKGGIVTVLLRPGHYLVAHIANKDAEETELASVPESLALAQLTAIRFAKRFGALYVPMMFG